MHDFMWELCIKLFMKSHDFIWELCIKLFYVRVMHKINYEKSWLYVRKHVSRYLWKIAISFEIYDTIWQVCMWFLLKSMKWQVCKYDYDKICNGLCYDMKTVPMLWAYCIVRSCILVVHPVCLPYVWIPQPAATGGIRIYLDSLTLTHGGQQWVTAYDKWKIS